jgi:DNA-binding PadR family transcriptional regulator
MDDKLLLLGLLRNQQMHGYQLYEFIGGGMSVCTDLKKPTAYYLLNKMAQDGWVEERAEQEGNRPPRKVYRLTADGEEAFQSLLRQNLADYQAPHFPGDIGLAFLEALSPQEARSLLEQRRAALAGQLAQVQAAPRHSGALQLLLDHQHRFLKGELSWIDRVIEKLINNQWEDSNE